MKEKMKMTKIKSLTRGWLKQSLCRATIALSVGAVGASFAVSQAVNNTSIFGPYVTFSSVARVTQAFGSAGCYTTSFVNFGGRIAGTDTGGYGAEWLLVQYCDGDYSENLQLGFPMWIPNSVRASYTLTVEEPSGDTVASPPSHCCLGPITGYQTEAFMGETMIAADYDHPRVDQFHLYEPPMMFQLGIETDRIDGLGNSTGFSTLRQEHERVLFPNSGSMTIVPGNQEEVKSWWVDLWITP